MSEPKTLLYRLAELMLEAGSNELSVDPLFDDPEIGDWVKSIQIDSPYQQMLLHGVLTESVKENELKVRFTFEGYLIFLMSQKIIRAIEKKNSFSLPHWLSPNDVFGIEEYELANEYELAKNNYLYFSLRFIFSMSSTDYLRVYKDLKKFVSSLEALIWGGSNGSEYFELFYKIFLNYKSNYLKDNFLHISYLIFFLAETDELKNAVIEKLYNHTIQFDGFGEGSIQKKLRILKSFSKSESSNELVNMFLVDIMIDELELQSKLD